MRWLLTILGIVVGLWLLLQAYVLLAGYYMPLEKLAASYLRVGLRRRGLPALPAGCVSEIASAYAAAATESSRAAERGRAATLSAMNRAMDTGLGFIEAWVRRGDSVPPAAADASGDGADSLILAPAFLPSILKKHRVPCEAAP